VIREFKYSLLTDGSLLSPEAAGEEVLLQGVTDCCMVENGALVILDFKSDRIRAGTEAAAAEYYRGQLDAYSMALQRIFSLPVRERLLYFFATDTAAAL
jgi:ATP-dependent helicase/nuclease subunit A